MKSPCLRYHGLETPDSAAQQPLSAAHQADGEIELTPEQARAYMERAFRKLAERRRNAEIIAAAQQAGTVVTHE